MYQQAFPAPWAGYATSRTRTGAFGDYFRGLSIVAWFFLLIVNFWWLKDWNDLYQIRETGLAKFIQYAAFTAPLLAHLTLGLNTLLDTTLGMFNNAKSRMLVWFCLVMFLLAPLSLNPLRSAGYAVATLGAVLVCRWAWEMDKERFRRIMALTSIVLFGFLLLLIFHHAISATGVGGIQRNRYGQAALTAMVAMFLTRGNWKWIGVFATIAFALVVNSRGTLVSIALFTVAYTTLKLGFGRGILLGLCALMAGISLLAVPKIGKRLYTGVVDDVMKVNDKSRGVGSGLTGRLETWEEGLRQFARRPIAGWGYRTRTAGVVENEGAYLAHSGYVNLLADAGLIGAVLVIGAFGYDFFKRWSIILQLKKRFGPFAPPDVADTLNLNYVVCAFLVAESALWLIEPLYLNLGASLSVLLLLLVMSPYYLGAAAYQQPVMAPPRGRRRM